MEQFLKDTIREAGKIALGMFQEEISYTQKTHRSNLLTKADLTVSDFFVEKISAIFPDHHIYTEELEDTINPGAEYEWVIDPIDGTFNFAHGIPLWCILVAVLQNGKTILAANYSPYQDKLYFAKKGEGAWLDDVKIQVNAHAAIDRSHGYFHLSPDRKELTISHIDLLQQLVKGGARYDDYGDHFTGCAVAKGDLDFFISNSGSDYDYLAPKLICEEAGAVVTDSEGNVWTRERPDIIIANPELHSQIMQIFSKK